MIFDILFRARCISQILTIQGILPTPFEWSQVQQHWKESDILHSLQEKEKVLTKNFTAKLLLNNQ